MLARIAATRWLAVLFLACALPTGLCLALLTPMGQVADEPAHIARAASLLHGQIMGQRAVIPDPSGAPAVVAGTMVNSGLISASLSELQAMQHGGHLSYRDIQAENAIPWGSGRVFDGASNTVQYFPALYLPGAIGIGLAHAFGLAPIGALYAGRVAMLLASIALGTAAIALAAFGRPLLFATLSLPMALSLAGSFNEDGVLIATTALAGALLTLDPRLHPRLRFTALPLLSLVICSKPPYGVLMFAFLCPLEAPGLWRRLVAVLLFALPPIAWVTLMMHFAEVAPPFPPYHPGPLWVGDPHQLFHAPDPAASLRVLLAKPARLFLMPLHAAIQGWHDHVLEGIGVLGWLSVPLARWAYHGWSIGCLCAAAATLFATGRRAIAWRAADGMFVLILVIASGFAIALALYLSWDPVGQAFITGLQGRYYLLLIPFLALALPRRPAPDGPPLAARVIEAGLALPALAMAVIDMGYLPWLILHRFYLGS